MRFIYPVSSGFFPCALPHTASVPVLTLTLGPRLGTNTKNKIGGRRGYIGS